MLKLWEPKVFLQLFEDSIICSDSWNNCLVTCTSNGVFVIDGNIIYMKKLVISIDKFSTIQTIQIEAIPWDLKQIFDKTVQVRQLDVCEQYGLMMLLIDKGRICVFKLNEFNQILNDSNWEQNQAKTRVNCKEHKIEFISGCTLYALSKQATSRTSSFKFVAACGKKLLIVETKCSNLCSLFECSAATCTCSIQSQSLEGAASPNNPQLENQLSGEEFIIHQIKKV